MNAEAKASPQNLARVAGFLYLLLGVFGMFGMMYVPTTLLVPEDATATAYNILASEGLFRSGIVGRLLTQTIQILTVLALYRLLKPVNKTHAALMVIFILLGVPLAMVIEVNQFAALLLLKNTDLAALFTVEQTQTMASLLLELHQHGIMIAHIFWGLWLFPMGYLVYKSGFIPRILGVLLMIGCFGYLIDAFVFMLAPHLDLAITEFTFIGEILLPLWLVTRGVNVENWRKTYAVALPTAS